MACKPFKQWIWIACLFLFAGCDSSARIDGSNPTALQDSLEVIRGELSEEQLEEFDYGVSAIRSSADQLGGGMGAIGGSSDSNKRFMDRIDGMTGAQVIAEGRRLREIREKKVQEMFPGAKFGDKS